MTPGRACTVVLLSALLASPAWAQTGRGGGQRTPIRDRQPSTAVPAGTGTIGGRVTSAEGAPVRRAQVQLVTADGGLRRAATTDNDGRYAFTRLPAGRYAVRASKGGFVSFAYGQRGMNEAVPPIILGDDESLTSLNIVLPRGSAITGRVTDEFGDAVLQAQVQALRYQYQPDGQRTLVPGGTQAATDDLGQFRLYGLTPGEYVISASTRAQFAGGPPRGQPADEPEEGYAPTFYPGTSNPAEAQAISVGLGQELTIPIQLVPSRLSRISGVAVDSQGRPASQGTPVMLRPAANLGGAGVRTGTVNSADGEFAIAGVPPGEYVLELRPRPVGRNQAANPASPAEGEFAFLPLTVSGDVTGIRVVTGKGATLSGRVVFEGTPPGPGVRVRVVPQAAEPSRSVPFAGRNRQEDGIVGADGSFSVEGITGPTFLRITLDGERSQDTLRYMTKSVLVDGMDVADVPFDPSRRGAIGGITLVVTDKLTAISGTVTDSSGIPVEATTVLIVPEPLAAGVSPTRFVRVLQSDPAGKFDVRGMPAGRYAAVALNRFDSAHQYDPDVIQRARQVGNAFSVREGESVTLDLKLTADF